MLHDYEDVENLKSDRRDCEEIHGPRFGHVVPKEGEPRLGLSSSSPGLYHVLSDRVRTGRIEAQELQVPMNPFSAPQNVFVTESPNKCLHFPANQRSPSFGSRFPPPPKTKRVSLPADDGIGLHQMGAQAPSVPELRENNPNQSESGIEFRTRFLLLLNSVLAYGKLAPDGNKLKANRGSGTQEHREESNDPTGDLSDGKKGGRSTMEWISCSFHASRISGFHRSRQSV